MRTIALVNTSKHTETHLSYNMAAPKKKTRKVVGNNVHFNQTMDKIVFAALSKYTSDKGLDSEQAAIRAMAKSMLEKLGYLEKSGS